MRQSILDGFRLLHHGEEAFLFCQKCLFVALQIHILQRHILCGFRFSRHIGLLGNSRQIAIELLEGILAVRRALLAADVELA